MAKRKRGRPKKKKSRKLSRMVLHRTKDTMELVSSIEAYKERLASAMAERYAPRLRPGETLPDYVLTLELAAREVKAALKRLIAIDDEVDKASVQRDLKRRQRNVLAGEVLQPRAVSVRAEIDQAYGREVGREVHGMKGQTRHRATLLIKQLRRLVIRLEKTDRELPPPSHPHAYVDRERWTRMLVPRYDELVKLDAEVVRLRDTVVPGLVLDKSRAMKEFDATYADVLRLVTSYFRMARFDLRAVRKLKPYYQRRRLSQQARSKRRARAAAGGEVVETARPPARETARVAVSKTVRHWLEKHRLFGT